MDKDLATDLVLVSVDRVNFLREQIQHALFAIDEESYRQAGNILARALKETDVGKMKVWQKGEQPF